MAPFSHYLVGGPTLKAHGVQMAPGGRVERTRGRVERHAAGQGGEDQGPPCASGPWKRKKNKKKWHLEIMLQQGVCLHMV